MKREIKFRAYGAINCFYLTVDGWKPKYLMCEVSSLNIKTNKCRVLYKGENNSNEYDTFELSKCKLMQFTGLKDKNGIDIYDGDILENPENKKSVVVWTLNGYFAESQEDDRITSFPLSIYFVENKKIIGNIYENPELLNK